MFCFVTFCIRCLITTECVYRCPHQLFLLVSWNTTWRPSQWYVNFIKVIWFNNYNFIHCTSLWSSMWWCNCWLRTISFSLSSFSCTTFFPFSTLLFPCFSSYSIFSYTFYSFLHLFTPPPFPPHNLIPSFLHPSSTSSPHTLVAHFSISPLAGLVLIVIVKDVLVFLPLAFPQDEKHSFSDLPSIDSSDFCCTRHEIQSKVWRTAVHCIHNIT